MRQTINSVQALRGAAALMVAFAHILVTSRDRYGGPVEPALTFGVDLFFMISGFVMVYANGDTPPATFARKRITRIVPLYWIATALMLAAFPLIERPIVAEEVLRSLFFWPTPHKPVLSVGWTLNYEMFFYALFGLSLFMRRGAFLLISVLAIVVGAGFAFDLPEPLEVWFDQIILEFAAGMAVGLAFLRRGKRLANRVGFAAAMAGAVIAFRALSATPLPRVIQASPMMLVLAACVLLLPERDEKRVPGCVLLLGAASYALYLFHPLVIDLVARFMPRWGPLPLVLVCLIAAVAAAISVHLLIERPLLVALRGKAAHDKREAPGG